jgi:predicted nuclease of predicted toxin-antitoxin system
MIVFDENVEEHWIQLIKTGGYDYYSIRENCPGVEDIKVIEIAKQKKGLLITEDKDFGELLFSHGVDKVAVLFMRYDQPQYEQIENYFLKCIDDYLSNPTIRFMTITKNKIRIRKM